MTNKLECVLYQSPLAIHHLDALGVENDGASLIVELSVISILAPVFDAQVKLRAGLAGLLADSSRLREVSRRFSPIKNPIILASRPAVPVQSTMTALGLLRQVEIEQDRIVVMIHLSEARRFAYALQLMESFAFLLDREDPVPFSLPDAARLLTYMQLVDEKSWNGLVTYAKKEHQATPERTRMWDRLYSEFGTKLVKSF